MKRIALVVLAVLLAGCEEQYREFPATITNHSNQPVVVHVNLHRIACISIDMGDRPCADMARDFHLPANGTWQERWRIPNGRYQIGMQAGNVTEQKEFYLCAPFSFRLDFNGAKFDLRASGSDGFGGC